MQLAHHIQRIEEKLSELIPERTSLHAAARYSLLAPSKRLRPLLTLVTAEALGASLEEALVPACALEFIHTYSLIHDDLPSMDNDDFRRGKPSLHRAYTEGHAVLAGDYLLTFAFQILSECSLSAEQRINLVRLLSLRSGDIGMIGGQVLDIACKGNKIDERELEHIHLGKTAALITCALEFGGIVANAPQEIMVLLNRAGKHIGHAFQIVDDLQDSEVECNEWTNILAHMEEDRARQKVKSLYEQAMEAINQLPHLTDNLKSLMRHSLSLDFN